jgi:hypothetical protein
MLLPYHAQAAQRRASYQPAGPEQKKIAWGYPACAALVLVAAWLIWLRWSKSSKRS